jgi:hypothetical protein
MISNKQSKSTNSNNSISWAESASNKNNSLKINNETNNNSN